MTPEKAKALLGRMGEFGADVENILQKLDEVYQLSIESTEERINPRVEEPVTVKVRNLAVARAAAMDMYAIHKELSRLSTTAEEQGDKVLRYELIKSFVTNDEEWTP